MEKGVIRLLYMEDDAGVARLLQKKLARQGYAIDIARDGEEGLAMLARDPYQATIVDYTMPLCGGIEVLKAMAGLADPPPVIMVTGTGDERVAVEALKLGAADYVVKDLDLGYLELLPMVIDQVLERQRLLRERERMVADLRESEESYRRLVELSPDGIAISEGGRLVFINPAGERLLASPGPAALLGMKVADFVHPGSRECFQEQLQCMAAGGCSYPWQEQRFIRCDMQEIDTEVAGVPFLHQGRPAVQIIFRDITERKQDKLRLEKMAHHDMLTGLPNRAAFFDRLTFLLEHGKRYRTSFALLFLDLDRFKEINDSLGHDMGDLLLREAADRLKGCLRKSDMVARVGGDEFTAILSRINSASDTAVAAEKLLAAMAKPFILHGISCSVGVSIGISVFPEQGDDVDTLMKKADSAMYLAKEGGRNTFRLFPEPPE